MHINVIVLLPNEFLLNHVKETWYRHAVSMLDAAVSRGDIRSDGQYLGWSWLHTKDPMDVHKECEVASGFLSDTTPYVHMIVTPDGDVKSVPFRQKGWSTVGGDPVDPRVDFYGSPYMVFDLHV